MLKLYRRNVEIEHKILKRRTTSLWASSFLASWACSSACTGKAQGQCTSKGGVALREQARAREQGRGSGVQGGATQEQGCAAAMWVQATGAHGGGQGGYNIWAQGGARC